ncbi:hypothetical protein AB1Y20_009052 [Prymnesium parvum]|uniref:Transmembrane protein n=1 Tax=Prymnesium parvum TaxID=97485 RepID=A0AB34K3Q7_PRYPA
MVLADKSLIGDKAPSNGNGEMVLPRTQMASLHSIRRGSLLAHANPGSIASSEKSSEVTENKQLRSLRELEGTRQLWLPLIVPQWAFPGAPRAVSHAAVLFDVAYAAALAHHAYVLVHSRASFSAWYSVAIYLVTAVPTIWQWWAISLFLCRFDPGDLCNEFILVVYMILVLGQSMTIQPCADCLLSANKQSPCELKRSETSLYSFLECTGFDGNTVDWPDTPFPCHMYIVLSIAPRAMHFLNTLRAVKDIGKRGREDMVCHAIELGCVLPIWVNALAAGQVYWVGGVWTVAAVAELVFIVIEPAHLAYHGLLTFGYLHQHSVWERVPLDIGYVEKRWHRLLMIALSMLPSFTTENIRFHFGATISSSFMMCSCSLAYIIKLFYFDVVDDNQSHESKRKQSGEILAAKHALQFQQEKRWRGKLWIASHVLLITAVCAVGRAMNKLLLPWDGYPDDNLQAVLQTRYLICAPVSAILLMLTLQHTLHVGGGRGLRRIGRRIRLRCRVITAILIALLPLTAIWEENFRGVASECLDMPSSSLSTAPATPPVLPPHPGAPPASPPHVTRAVTTSREFFLINLFIILLLQLIIELYGRGYSDGADSRLTLESMKTNSQEIPDLTDGISLQLAYKPSNEDEGGGALHSQDLSGCVSSYNETPPRSELPTARERVATFDSRAHEQTFHGRL